MEQVATKIVIKMVSADLISEEESDLITMVFRLYSKRSFPMPSFLCWL